MQVEKPFVFHGGLEERFALIHVVGKRLDGTGVRQHGISRRLFRESSRQELPG
jgi:hypothetical protein